jgi:probable rRNA maturation factor
MDSDSSCSIEVTIEVPEWTSLVADPDGLCRSAAKAALDRACPRPGHVPEIGILLTGDARIRELNRIWRHQDKPTNVLSFPAELAPADLPPGTPVPLGDVALALETVRAEALAEGTLPAHHLAHLVVHGVLHLLGHDHEGAVDAGAMESLETAILAEIGVPDPWAEAAA